MNTVNHLLRLKFFTWSYPKEDRTVALKSDVVAIRPGRSFPRRCWIQTDEQSSRFGHWNRRILEDFANSPGTPADIVSFTECYEALAARIQPGMKKGIRFKVSDWQRLQGEFKNTWEKLGQGRGRLKLPMGQMAVLTGESFHLWFSDLNYETANLYRLLLLELHSLPRHRLRKCKGEKCSTPYFIADHLSRRYCTACKESARRETKRRSWQKHKEAWRR